MRNFIRRLKSWIVSGRTVGNHTYNLKVPSSLMAEEMADPIKDRPSNCLRSFQSPLSAAVGVIVHNNCNIDGNV
jgi:hypothetical protein